MISGVPRDTFMTHILWQYSFLGRGLGGVVNSSRLGSCFVFSPSLQHAEEQCAQLVADQQRCTKENQESNCVKNQARASPRDPETLFQNHATPIMKGAIQRKMWGAWQSDAKTKKKRDCPPPGHPRSMGPPVPVPFR